MFHVIEFTSLNEVAVAPSNWISQSDCLICLWPPIKAPSKLSKMVKARAVPETSWEQYEIRSLGTFAAYEEARKRLRKAEETSDLQSDIEETRKRKKKRFSDDESDEEESQSLLPSAPYIPRNINAAIQSHTPPNPFFHAPSTSKDSTPQCAKSQTLLRQQKHLMTYITPSQPNTQLSFNTEFLEQPLTLNTTHTSNSQILAQKVNDCSCHTLNTQILKSIEKELQAHTKILQSHTNMLSHLYKEIPQTPNANNIYSSKSLPEGFPSNLPLKSVEDLSLMEDVLKEDSNFSQTLSFFVAFGGSGKRNVLQRLLSQIISQDLALQLNWKGRGDKHGFHSYNRIHGLIYQAAKFHVKDMTLDDAEKFTKDWLRFAPDRNGMRKFRKK